LRERGAAKTNLARNLSTFNKGLKKASLLAKDLKYVTIYYADKYGRLLEDAFGLQASPRPFSSCNGTYRLKFGGGLRREAVS
jgi:hypothetical protein